MSRASLQHFRSSDYTDHPQRHGHHVHPEDGIGSADGQTVQTCGFDYDAVDKALGLREPITPRDKAFADAADLLEVLAVWIADSGTITSAGRRALALAYALRPGSFPDRSTAALARRMGTTRQSLLKYTSEIYRMAHGLFVTRTMQSNGRREKQVRIAKSCHAKAGHILHPKT